MTAVIQISGVSHQYGSRRALDAVSFDVGQGEILSVLGPSGCGKSTLLRIIAGLERLETGSIALDGKEVARAGFSVPPERRNVGLVFQDYALFPHLSVADNVRFGMGTSVIGAVGATGANSAKGGTRQDALALLKRVGLADRADSFPHTLSGGEQQRVALVRSLATHPSLMLMDEPFAGLDTGLRAAVREQTLELLKERGCAAIIVTHDASEAMEISDRILVLREGRLEQEGSPAAIYLEPRSPFVARFFGGSSTLRGQMVGPTDVRCGPLRLHPGNARFATSLAPAASAGSSVPAGGEVDIVVRPEAVQLVAGDGVPNALRARVQRVVWMGETVRVKLALDLEGTDSAAQPASVIGSFPTWLWHRRIQHGDGGEIVRLTLESSGVHVFQHH